MKVLQTLLFLILITFPFGVLAKLPIHPFSPEINLYLLDIFVFLFVICWVIFLLVKRRKLVKPPLWQPLLAFISIALISLLVNTPRLDIKQFIVSFSYLLRFASYAGFYVAIYNLKQSLKELERQKLEKMLIVEGLSVAVFGFVQFFLWPNLKVLEDLGWDPHFYRLVGTFLDPGFTGIILVLTLVLIRRVNPLSIFVFAALLLTQSRASWLAFFVVITALAFIKKMWRLYLLLLVLAAGLIILIPKPQGEGGKLTRIYSIESRVVNWQETFSTGLNNPILGVGYNTLRKGSDSSLLFVLATTGILGLAAYLWFWGKILTSRNMVVLLSALALLTHSLFLNSLFFPWILFWLSFILALL